MPPRTSRPASTTFAASAMARATACSSCSSCSMRLVAVTSRPTPREPLNPPHSSTRGCAPATWDAAGPAVLVEQVLRAEQEPELATAVGEALDLEILERLVALDLS